MKTKKVTSLKSNLYGLFTGFASFFVLFALLLFSQAYIQKQISAELSTDSIPGILAVNTINTDIINYRITQASHVFSSDNDEKNELERTLQHLDNEVANWRTKYKSLLSNEKEKSLYAQFSKNYDDYRIFSRQLLTLSQNNETEKAVVQLKKSADLINICTNYLAQLVSLNTENANTVTKKAEEVFTHARLLIIVSSLLMSLAACILAGIVMRMLRPTLQNQPATRWTQWRIPFTFLVLVLLISGFSRLIFERMDNLNDATKTLNSKALPSLIVINALNTDVSNYRRYEAMHLAMTEEKDMLEREQGVAKTATKIQAEINRYQQFSKAFSDISEEEKNSYADFLQSYNNYLIASKLLLTTSRSGDKQKAIELFKENGILFNTFTYQLDNLSDYYEQSAINTHQEIEAIYTQIKIIIVDGGLVILMALLIAAQLLDLWATPQEIPRVLLDKKRSLLPKVFTIKIKLRFTFAGVVALFVLFSILVNLLMLGINKESNEIGLNWMPSILVVNAINTATSDYRIAEAQHILATSAVNMARWEKELANKAGLITKLRKQYERLISSEEEKNIYTNFALLYDQYMVSSKEGLILSRQNSNIEATKEFNRRDVVFNAFSIELNKLVKLNERGGMSAVHNSERLFNESTQIRLFLSLLVTMICMTCIILLEKNIAYPLQRLTNGLQHLARGDIEVNHSFENRHDEIGQMAEAVAEVTHTLQALISDSLDLIEAAQAGVLSTRIELGTHPGDFNKIVLGMNQLLEVLSKPLTEVAQVMQNLALGDLAGRIQGDYEGELRALKVNVNRSLDALVNLLSELGATTQFMANGDLTHTLTGNYQGEFSVLKANMNQTIAQLKEILQVVLSNTTASATAITQTSEASLYVAKEVSLQKVALDEIAHTIEETSLSINEVSCSATKGNELACATSQFAHQGQEQLNKLLGLMQQVAAEYNRIEQITGEITRIADKTHLLSLNAGLEAMRAGEHGLGFGFVAQQIGKLAEEVGLSARDIGTVINSSAQSVHLGLAATQETRVSIEQITHSAQSSEETVQTIFASIVQQSAAIQLLSKRVAEIQTGSKSTAATADEISVTMIHLAQTIQETATQAQRFTLS